MRKVLVFLFTAVFLASLATPLLAKSPSPILGGANVTALSKDQSAQVVGKGYYADLYGYYGLIASNNANYYGLYGHYYKSYSYYYYASQYAYDAYYYFYYAYYYQYYNY